jgi:hypothetical protein
MLKKITLFIGSILLFTLSTLASSEEKKNDDDNLYITPGEAIRVPINSHIDFPKRIEKPSQVQIPDSIKQQYTELQNKFQNRLGAEKIKESLKLPQTNPSTPSVQTKPLQKINIETSYNNSIKNNISPFSPETDTYTVSVQSIFENLPLITDPNIIKNSVTGNNDIIKTIINKKLSGTQYFHKYYYNIKIIDKEYIETRGPIKTYNDKFYIWTIKGYIQHFYKNKKIEEPFFFATHYDNNSKTWNTDYFCIGTYDIELNTTTQNAAALIAEPLRKKKIEILYKKSIEKEKWDFNNREIQGKLTGYKNGKVSIQEGNKRPFQMDVTKFSLEDQKLIRAYIEHLNIPVRELQNKK